MPLVPLAPAPPRLRILAYGEPGGACARFALGFPRPIVVDPLCSAQHCADAATDARQLVTSTPRQILGLINALARGQEQAGTLVLNDFSSIYDAIGASLLSESRHVYYERRRWTVGEIVRATISLSCHTVVITRSTSRWARAGDIVDGRVIGPSDERIALGDVPDIDATVPYEVDLVVQLIRDPTRGAIARIEHSQLAAFAVGETLAPTYAAFAERLPSAHASADAAPAPELNEGSATVVPFVPPASGDVAEALAPIKTAIGSMALPVHLRTAS